MIVLHQFSFLISLISSIFLTPANSFLPPKLFFLSQNTPGFPPLIYFISPLIAYYYCSLPPLTNRLLQFGNKNRPLFRKGQPSPFAPQAPQRPAPAPDSRVSARSRSHSDCPSSSLPHKYPNPGTYHPRTRISDFSFSASNTPRTAAKLLQARGCLGWKTFPIGSFLRTKLESIYIPMPSIYI